MLMSRQTAQALLAPPFDVAVEKPSMVLAALATARRMPAQPREQRAETAKLGPASSQTSWNLRKIRQCRLEA